MALRAAVRGTTAVPDVRLRPQATLQFSLRALRTSAGSALNGPAAHRTSRANQARQPTSTITG